MSSKCHSVKVPSVTVGYYPVSMVTDLCCHLTYNSRGAWHTSVCHAPLKLWDAVWNLYNGKVWFSQIYNSQIISLFLVISTIFTKGNNFSDFLFASLDKTTLLKQDRLWKRACSCKIKFLPLGVDPDWEKVKKIMAEFLPLQVLITSPQGIH